MLQWITKERKWIFAAGAATGLALLSLLKTKKARDIAVKSVAGGIMLKDKFLETAANIKEEADDICAEAKVAAKGSCSCGGGCGCEESSCGCGEGSCGCGDDCKCTGSEE